MVSGRTHSDMIRIQRCARLWKTARTPLDVDVPAECRSENQIMAQFIMASLFAQDLRMSMAEEAENRHQEKIC